MQPCSGLKGLLLAAVILVGAGTGAHAGDLATGEWATLPAGARVRLVGFAGATLLAGVQIELAPGWKTYWRMPGEAGVPPQFEWKGSTNLAAAKVRYPAPVRMLEAGSETIGYKHALLLPVEVTAATKGQPVALHLELELGICREICVPAQAQVALTLPTATTDTAVPELLAQALALVPRTAEEPRTGGLQIVKQEAVLDGATPHLAVDARVAVDSDAVDLFFEGPDGGFLPLPKRVVGQAGLLRFTAKLSPDTARELKGKTVTMTLVDARGGLERTWALPK